MHDTYFVVGHFHYVLSMGALFGTYAGFYYWFPKMTGYTIPRQPALAHFWLTFVGVNLVFFPMHFLGLAGMPRRIPDYPDAFAGWNAVSSFGSYVSLFGTMMFFYTIYVALTEKKLDKPVSHAWTLDFVLKSPPDFHTFSEIPVIKRCT